ncbi:UTP--glucose-1-phosphate uridylyltransferase GalU [Sansalvadorimonas sp. 2012CJ34-2]|uniref:UTP--glucose-1-phosphate uridylyltransferase n=1 Tax=Parendozoicomonas callyspongiae TaxID=2942213 RepID=A0ABT0PHB6_9GAMM|nr:UTP--glucose-1-phosphate uridylyltransferase GalU [Sansalvadorimonas sp. 2012CJ34-2]MCL6270770.1 UTP--glucose-1-phosphate uridylyltransferase GalU [Sansalvadorimonas sp. 2012CJ34-2]
MDIRKAVFPVAGMGTRFLPATKATPKEMLPVVDKPLIQYAVEEAIEVGIKDLIFVTSYTKVPVINHFDKNFELEYRLQEAGKKELLDIVKNILPEGVNCFYVRQPEALGLGHAVLCAKDIVGNEPFTVLLADDMIYCEKTPCLNTMVDIATENQSSVVAVEQVPMERVSSYGVIDPVKISDRFYRLQGVVEKPPVEKAPSNLSIVGRYVLQPRIFELLETTPRGAGGEIQLTDAIAALLQEQAVHAYEFDGIRYDCGSKMGHMKANVEYALRHPELNGQFREYLKQLSF